MAGGLAVWRQIRAISDNGQNRNLQNHKITKPFSKIKIPIYLMGVYLTGVHLMSMYVTGVYLMSVHLMSMYLMEHVPHACIS